MTEQKLDELLKDMYQKESTVPKEWNERLIEKQKTGYRLPRSGYRRGIAAAVLLLCLIGISGSVYAAYHYLTPAQTAEEMGMNTLAEKFAQQEDEVLSITTKGYHINYLGVLTGKNLADGLEGAEVDKEKTYIVTAIQKENGTAMTYSDHFFIGPFIKGLNPIHYNITAQGSSATRMIDHGIMYCISECDAINIFAGRGIYLVVQEGTFYDIEAYSMDEKTGVLTANKEYQKVNALFEVKLDERLADEEKVQAYIDKTEKETSETPSEDDKENDSYTIEDVTFPEDAVAEYGNTTVKLRAHGRGYRNIVDMMSDNNSIIHFLPEIEGEDIKNVTFNVRGGEFCTVDTLTRKQADAEKEKLQSKYQTVGGTEIDGIENYYGVHRKGTSSILIPTKNKKAKAHFVINVPASAEYKTIAKTQKHFLDKINKLKITMKIQKKDGSIIEKEIRCRTSIYFSHTIFDNDTRYHAYYEYLLPQ